MKKRLSVLCAFMLLALLVPSNTFAQTEAETASIFPDVPANSFNFDAISNLKQSEIVQGYPDGTYKPANNINRAEFTKIVMGPIIQDMTKTDCFPDVKAEWFAPYVCAAKEMGVIEGYPDGEFKPAEQINFSEAAKIISKTYNLSSDSAVSARTWFKPSVEALQANNAIPLSVSYFDEKIDRGEMAEMIYRIKEKNTSKATRTFGEISGEEFASVSSCQQLYERFQYQNEQQSFSYDMQKQSMARDEGLGSGEPESAPKTGGGTDHSTTNTQVEGVDEADIIKNDGKYIYLVKGSTLRIIEAYPSNNLKELVSFSLGENENEFHPSEIYINGNQMVVLGSYHVYNFEKAISSIEPYIWPPYGYGRAKAYIVDITDRTSPKVQRSVEFDGNLNNSRRIGNTLYMVINKYDHPYYIMDEKNAEDPVLRAKSLIPKFHDSTKGKDELVAGCEDIRILPKPDNFNFLIVAAVPLDDINKAVDREVVVGTSHNIYSSSNTLYVASTDWSGGYYKSNNDYGTSIYKFNLEKGKVAYDTKGKVPGTVLNQFSMDQHNGKFRIVTTKNEFVPGSQINNNLYVLDENMKQIGALENIAPGEKLYSSRFMEERAYLITFKRVDPLFVIGLSDPTKPKILGELKIPGYSTYLHPYDQNHLIGFGNEVEEQETDSKEDFLHFSAIQGMKIGLFDVTDVNNPKEKFKEVIGNRGTYSELLYNHKALLFDKEKNLLSFPITVYELPNESVCSNYTYSTCPTDCTKICVAKSCTYENGIKVCTPDCDGENSCVQREFTYGEPVFDGAYVYNIDLANGFTLKGKITHYTDEEIKSLSEKKYTNYQKTIKRVLYIGENLYTVSNSIVKANLMNDLSEKGKIELAGGNDEFYWY
jgi:inhibitor of cysteine peptidase